MKKAMFIVQTALCLLIACAVSAQTVTFRSLLEDMVDRDLLPRYPSPDYSIGQQGSFDRATSVKDGPGWFANGDNNQFLRVEDVRGRTEFVMFEADGPGAIVRFWMTFGGANRGNGMLRFYFDGSDVPEIEGTAIGILSGKELADACPLATSVSELTPIRERGHNLYLPLPYGRSCKITYEPKQVRTDNGRLVPADEIVYYNINYRQYEEGTSVKTFTKKQLEANSSLVRNVCRLLDEKYRSSEDMKLSSLRLDAEIASDGEKSFEITGTKAVRHLMLKVSGEDEMQALRSTVLEISFDGNRTVWVPIGEFFGVGYRRNYTNTWYTHSTKDGEMNSYWVMPFRKSCHMTIHNYGSQPVAIEGVAEYGRWSWDSRSMYFGSDWHQYSGISTKPRNAEGKIISDGRDINFTTIKGKGVYVGDGVNVFNTMPGSWWGEGDEKIYVDGEDFPSMIGTGTEDYFGYAWCSPNVFTDHPFIAQPEGRGSFEAAVSVNTRLRSLDAIPFRKGLVFDMELLHWDDGKMNYAPVTFWYVLPGGTTEIMPDPDAARAPVIRKRSQITSDNLFSSVIEAENMTVSKVSGGNVSYQSGARWSNGEQIFWTGLEPGYEMELKFRTGYTGEFNVSFTSTLAKDYGTVNVYLNGKLIGKEIDLYSPYVTVGTFDLGFVELRGGVNTLTVKQVRNARDENKTVFGFDKIVLHE